MIYLLLSILSSSVIYVIFKKVNQRGADTFTVIVVNYITAGSLAFLVSLIFYPDLTKSDVPWHYQWFPFALITGFLFISIFYLMALTTQRIGVAVTSVASKLSLVIPVLFFVIRDSDETLTVLKGVGILLAIAGVLLTSRKMPGEIVTPNSWWLPLTVFVGSGALDSVLAFSQKHLMQQQGEASLFTATGFCTAFILGVIVLLFRKDNLAKIKKSAAMGLLLGSVNVGSIVFLLLALGSSLGERSTILPINNMGIVFVSTLLGAWLFTEPLKGKRALGIVVSLLAIALLSFT